MSQTRYKQWKDMTKREKIAAQINDVYQKNMFLIGLVHRRTEAVEAMICFTACAVIGAVYALLK